jgi:hypothetical protein
LIIFFKIAVKPIIIIIIIINSSYDKEKPLRLQICRDLYPPRWLHRRTEQKDINNNNYILPLHGANIGKERETSKHITPKLKDYNKQRTYKNFLFQFHKTKLPGFGPRANYTDRANAVCWRSSTNFCG